MYCYLHAQSPATQDLPATLAPLDILLFPACGGLAVVSALKYREQRRPGLLVLAGLAALACIVNLVLGIASLLQALGG